MFSPRSHEEPIRPGVPRPGRTIADTIPVHHGGVGRPRTPHSPLLSGSGGNP